MTNDVAAAIVAIDTANEEDPNRVGGRGRAAIEGERATKWLEVLNSSPPLELRLAVRAHHLRRWEIDRGDYELGRVGYLRWRRANKAHQAAEVAVIMDEAGFGPAEIQRVAVLLGRKQLELDPHTQTLEDAACLTFLETQFEDLVERLEEDHLVSIVAKTTKKMSPAALELVCRIRLGDRAQWLIGRVSV